MPFLLSGERLGALAEAGDIVLALVKERLPGITSLVSGASSRRGRFPAARGAANHAVQVAGGAVEDIAAAHLAYQRASARPRQEIGI